MAYSYRRDTAQQVGEAQTGSRIARKLGQDTKQLPICPIYMSAINFSKTFSMNKIP